MTIRRRRRIAKPVQRLCQRCTHLFCYFQITKARLYCGGCRELERQDSNDVHNGIVSVADAAARAA